MTAFVYVFLVFFITLGPPRVVPAFAALAEGLAPADRKRLAIAGVAAAGGIVLVVALFGFGLRQLWELPWKALSIAVGAILFLSAVRSMWEPGSSAPALPLPDRPWRALAVSPLAAPIILTPYGVAAVLLFMAAREGDGGFVLKVLGALAAVMALNLAMLLNAGRVLRVFGASPVRVAGWVFAVLLAVLAVQAVVEPVRAYVADLRATQSDFDDDGVYENALFTPRHAAHRLSDRPNRGVIADRSGRRPD